MNGDIDYTWESAALQRMPPEDTRPSVNLNELSEEGIILDFSALKLVNGEKVTITGNFDDISILRESIIQYKIMYEGHIIQVINEKTYLTYELDDEDRVIATLHLVLECEEEAWLRFLREEMHQINAPGNLYWVGSNFNQEQ